MADPDDELLKFEAEGGLALSPSGRQDCIASNGAEICYYDFAASGPAVILLHGGLGNSRNWGYQVPSLLRAGYRVILIDSRGHGRSTRDEKPFSYHLMAGDVFAVLDALKLKNAALIGWSDGAATALVAAKKTPSRVLGVFFFGCNVDPIGTLPFVFTPKIGRCVNRHRKDYAELSPTPEEFDQLMAALGPMQQSQPDYSVADLEAVSVPVTVAHAEHDEFIRAEHAAHLANSIPGAELVVLNGVSHFAPVQRPELFNQAILTFLERLPTTALSANV